MEPHVIELCRAFVHSGCNRRLFLDKTAKLTGGVSAALTLMPLLRSNSALASVVAGNDPRLTTERLTYRGASGEVNAYLAKPKDTARHGGIVVLSQNRGLDAHIEDVTRRLAVEGYVALAPDFLSPLGGTPADQNLAIKMIRELDIEKVTGDANAAANLLLGRPDSNGKVGAVGFCWGGSVANQMAVTNPVLKAISVYYGLAPEPVLVPKIRAALLLNYADPELDRRVGATVPAYEQALKAAKIKYDLYYYQGADHAFNDDTQPARYNAAAAKLAWRRTLALFTANLR